ncbi:uncharacterized protein A4U43_C04F18850 [Asparagus officinalis]|uniref:Uncharacterized protein n=1 Tax=Asparagus officinalis TaxID=4686 RepID=A0A5P1F2J2_ASPOF|nr:uncharacterized protein A4U43_C04F18850 [Asparagus officinalis]
MRHAFILVAYSANHPSDASCQTPHLSPVPSEALAPSTAPSASPVAPTPRSPPRRSPSGGPYPTPTRIASQNRASYPSPAPFAVPSVSLPTTDSCAITVHAFLPRRPGPSPFASHLPWSLAHHRPRFYPRHPALIDAITVGRGFLVHHPTPFRLRHPKTPPQHNPSPHPFAVQRSYSMQPPLRIAAARVRPHPRPRRHQKVTSPSSRHPRSYSTTITTTVKRPTPHHHHRKAPPKTLPTPPETPSPSSLHRTYNAASSPIRADPSPINRQQLL